MPHTTASSNGSTWQDWWFYNSARYLDLRTKVRRHEQETDSPDLFTGAGAIDG